MSLVLLVSVTLRLIGTVWAAALARRIRAAPMALLALMLALMTVRQSATLVLGWRDAAQPFTVGPYSEVPGLAVSALALVAVAFLSRFLDERRRRETALRHSEGRMRSFAESSPDFMVVIDLDGKVEWVNRTVPELDPETVVGRHATEFIPPEDGARVTEIFRRVTETGLPDSYEVVFTGGDSPRVMETRVAPIVNGGRVTGLVATSTDVTERRHLEHALARSRRLDALGTLAGGLAHDFNNLLTAILGNVDRTKDAAARIADPAVRDDLVDAVQRIEDASEKAASLTRKLLAFGRRRGRSAEVTDVNAAILGLDDLIRGIAGEAVEVHVRLAEGLGGVRIAPSDLEQIVLNLVINARDAVAGGGRISIATTTSEASGGGGTGRAPTGSEIVIRVTDDGVGMDEATVARAFDPFFTTKAVGEGSGLGLATVYGLVRQAGGRVEIDSFPGRGTTLEVHLPATAGTPSSPTASRREPARRGGTEVLLLCDDDAAVRNAARRALESAGYTVLESDGAQAAIERAAPADVRIDALVTDVVMPGMTGARLAAVLTDERPDLRVLFISGYAPDSIDLDHVPADARSFLEKPFTPSELLDAVRELLDRPLDRSTAAHRPVAGE